MIGEEIKKARKQKKWTQKKLAEELGISVSYVQQLENGIKSNPSFSIITDMCKKLDIDIERYFEDRMGEFIYINLNYSGDIRDLE